MAILSLEDKKKIALEISMVVLCLEEKKNGLENFHGLKLVIFTILVISDMLVLAKSCNNSTHWPSL